MPVFVWIALGGAAGAASRATLASAVQRAWGARFPAGTFAVNALGCFLFGLAWALFEPRVKSDSAVRFAVLSGFLGAFTTFSTFAFETTRLLGTSRWGAALLNVLGQNALGVVAVVLGILVGRLL